MSVNDQVLEELKAEIGEKDLQEMMNAVCHGDHYDHIRVNTSRIGNGVVTIDLHDREIDVEFYNTNGKIDFDNWMVTKKFSQTPKYYGTDEIDPITYMKQHNTHEEVKGFYKGNILKYLTRADKKNGLEDYKKAAHYMTMLLEWEAKG